LASVGDGRNLGRSDLILLRRPAGRWRAGRPRRPGAARPLAPPGDNRADPAVLCDPRSTDSSPIPRYGEGGGAIVYAPRLNAPAEASIGPGDDARGCDERCEHAAPRRDRA